MSGSSGDVWDYLSSGEKDNGREYYLGPEETVVHHAWGEGAERLGLDRLDPVSFERLSKGRDPHTGQDLGIQTQNGKHSLCIDFAASPPKSVSVAYATARDDAERADLEACMDAADRKCLETFQDLARVTRPTRDIVRNGEAARGQVREQGGLVVGMFRHHTSRPCPETVREGRPPDPHVHTHLVFFNMAWNEGSQKWMAMDSYGLFMARKFAQAAYDCELVHQLRQRGYGIDTTTHVDGKRTWELRGHDPRAVDLFSSRHRQVEEIARQFEDEHGRPASTIERRNIARDQRLPKDADHGREPDWQTYQGILRDRGLDWRGVHPQPPGPDMRPDAIREAELSEAEKEVVRRLVAADGLTAKDAAFHRAEVRLKVYECATGLLSKDQADKLMDGPALRKELVRLNDRYLTTQSNLDREADIVDTAERKRTASTVRPSTEQVQSAVGRWKDRTADADRTAGRPARTVELSDDQARALRRATGRESMVMLLGYAGTGKGVVMEVAADAFREAGCTVYASAVGGERALDTGERIGAKEGMTIERFCGLVDAGKVVPDAATVVFLDEAVQVDTPRMQRLLAAAGDARIIAVGDPKQFQAIGAGGWWKDADRVLGHVKLTTIKRHRSAIDRKALTMMRDGKVLPVLKSFDRRHQVHRSSTPEWAKKDIVDAWEKHRGEVGTDQTMIVTDYPNPDIDWLNRACQEKRMAAGELGADVLVARTHVSYGERVEDLRVGDRIQFKAHRPQDIRNRQRATITAVDLDRRQLAAKLENGREVVVPVPDGPKAAQLVRLNYAGHTMKMQGAEAERVLALPCEKTSRSIEQGYPLMTRHVGRVFLFLDRQSWGDKGRDVLDKLADHWSVSREKVTARSRMADRRADRAQERAYDRDMDRTG